MIDSSPDRRRHARGHAMGILSALVALALTGCTNSPKLPVSDAHILAPKTAAAPDDIGPLLEGVCVVIAWRSTITRW